MSSLKDRLHLPEHVAGVEAMPTRDDRFATRLRGFGSVGIPGILIILAGNFVIAPLSAILVLVWARLSHTPLREIGYVRPKSWIRSLVTGIVLGIAFKVVMKRSSCRFSAPLQSIRLIITS
jgi:hypothetical protein